MIKKILSPWFLQNFCLSCNAPGQKICQECQNQIHFLDSNFCKICGLPTAHKFSNQICASCSEARPHYSFHRSLLCYDELSKKMIHNLKYKSEFWILNFISTECLHSFNTQEYKTIDLILPIPLHKTRLIERGFNQSLLLSKIFAEILSKPIGKHLFIRKKATPTQTSLSQLQRQKNLSNAFHVPSHSLSFIKNKNILLIDDVHTTGSTLNEAAKTLKHSGAQSVCALTICSVI